MVIRSSSSSGIPFGESSGRPANANLGQPYFNATQRRLEIMTGNGWQNIVSETPSVTGINGSYLESNATSNITIVGTSFAEGCTAQAIGANGVIVDANSTTVNSAIEIVANFSGLSGAQEPYDIRVTNLSNLYGQLNNILYVNESPIWQTSAGSLGTFGEQVSISVSATATDPESTTITYSLAAGSTLPSGVTLNSSTGLISGTLPDIASNTTYTFTINASDGANAVVPRTFSIASRPLFSVEYLVVAGGGGGAGGNSGDGSSGGGGAGGLLYGSKTSGAKTSVLVTVGQGGNGGLGASNGGSSYALRNGSSGNNSIFDNITSTGGGLGRCQDGNAGGAGGSGGGGAGGGSPLPGAGGTGISGQGNNGGAGTTSPYQAGAGGGAGAVGGSSGGAGGVGLSYSITGTATYYAGGGGPGANQYAGGGNAAGGAGGGGAGGSGIANGTSGTTNTGGGGGAGGANGSGGSGGNGGNGGSGIVIIAYPDTFSAITTIPGTLTYDQPTRAGYRVYRFTAGTGTITF